MTEEKTYNFTSDELKYLIKKCLDDCMYEVIEDVTNTITAHLKEGPKRTVATKASPKKPGSFKVWLKSKFNNLKGDEKRYYKVDGGDTTPCDIESRKGGRMIKNIDALLTSGYNAYDVDLDDETCIAIIGLEGGIIKDVLQELECENPKKLSSPSKKSLPSKLAVKAKSNIKRKAPPPIEANFDDETGLNLTFVSGIHFVVDEKTKNVTGYVNKNQDYVILDSDAIKILKTNKIAFESISEDKFTGQVNKSRIEHKWDTPEEELEDESKEPEEEPEEIDFDEDEDDDLIDSTSESNSKTMDKITQDEFEKFYKSVKIGKVDLDNKEKLISQSGLNEDTINTIIVNLDELKENYKIIVQKVNTQNTPRQPLKKISGKAKRGRGRGGKKGKK